MSFSLFHSTPDVCTATTSLLLHLIDLLFQANNVYVCNRWCTYNTLQYTIGSGTVDVAKSMIWTLSQVNETDSELCV